MYIHNSSPSRVITTLVEKDMEKKREAGKTGEGMYVMMLFKIVGLMVWGNILNLLSPVHYN